MSEEITHQKVEINLTTALHNLVAFLYSKEGNISVLLSGRCKRESEAVVAVAHEIAHSQTKSDKHDLKFRRSFKKVLSIFSERMRIPEKDLEEAIERLNEP